MSDLKLKDYEVIRKIGRKFCFTVYEAVNLIEEEKRFLKILNKELIDDTCTTFFLNSARIASKLNNKNICKVYSFGKENESYLIDSEFVDLKPLNLFIHEEFPFPLKTVIDILNRVSGVLRQTHLSGIVHGVLNPSSIFLAKNNEIVIDDFCYCWIASYLPKLDESEATYLSSFMAPELFNDKNIFDGRADIYSLGVILQQLLTDELPLNGLAKSGAQPRQSNGSATSLSKLYPEHSSKLEKILKLCLNKNPENRYFNLNQFIKDLKSLNIASSNLKPTQKQIVSSKR